MLSTSKITAQSVDVGMWIPVAGDIPEEDVISNDLDHKLFELIEVSESEDLVNNGFNLNFRKSCRMPSFSQYYSIEIAALSHRFVLLIKKFFKLVKVGTPRFWPINNSTIHSKSTIAL